VIFLGLLGLAWLLLILPVLITACREVFTSPPSRAYKERGFWGTGPSGAFGGFGSGCGGDGGCGGFGC
jgi:hypothetical protein